MLPHWGSYVFVKKHFEILVSEYSEQSKTSRNVTFSWCPDVCVCARVCPIFNVSKPDNSKTTWDIDIKFSTPVKQSQPFNRDYFHDNWCRICGFVGFWIFWKKDVVVLTFVKFELSSYNYTQIYYIDQGTLVLNSATIHSSVQIFSDFQFFKNFLQIVSLRQISICRAEISCINALILSDV